MFLIHNYNVLVHNASKSLLMLFDAIQKIFMDDVIEYERKNKNLYNTITQIKNKVIYENRIYRCR